MSASKHRKSGSWSSDEEGPGGRPLEPAILVYHESARSIVFRDHLRRAVQRIGSSSTSSSSSTTTAPEETASSVSNSLPDYDENSRHHRSQPSSGSVLSAGGESPALLDHKGLRGPEGLAPMANYQPILQPLPSLQLGPDDQFEALLNSPTCAALDSRTLGREPDHPSHLPEDWTAAEKEVVTQLQRQKCCVKTIKNVDWTSFLRRFLEPHVSQHRGACPSEHDDVPPIRRDPSELVEGLLEQHPDELIFNSFVTSTTLLPTCGQRMRAYGSDSQYTVGVIFALPDQFDDGETEDEAAARTQTWSWPAGYSAKTEFNIDGRGHLINGRQEALVPFSVLRQYNDEYVFDAEYTISAGTSARKVSGLNQIPYNEVFLRVGGLGRMVRGVDAATGQPRRRSFERGVGLPVALFVRTATFGHLISLLRTRARLMNVLGEKHFQGIPLLLLTPDNGVRVLTESLQKELWKIAAQSLNPFQNPTIAHRTTMKTTDEESFQQKVDELLDLDEGIRSLLTPEELTHLAGGFGATDESVATVLQQVMMEDLKQNQPNGQDEALASSPSHRLQDVVNEGLAAAVRAGDYHTSRQLLILYSLVSTQGYNMQNSTDDMMEEKDDCEEEADGNHNSKEEKAEGNKPKTVARQSSLGQDVAQLKNDLELVKKKGGATAVASRLPAPPPPPPLDTDRLRSATNSDGLLAVLGAAQVLKAMQDGGAKRRVHEAISAVEEWVNYGEQSVAFRISSWYDQRAAQGDLKIATENDSNFFAFISNKALANRKAFAQQLREAAENTDFTDVRFLEAIDAMLKKMHSPCLRLELLQYVLGLDNRYSVAHVARSVELAALCLGIRYSE